MPVKEDITVLSDDDNPAPPKKVKLENCGGSPGGVDEFQCVASEPSQPSRPKVKDETQLLEVKEEKAKDSKAKKFSPAKTRAALSRLVNAQCTCARAGKSRTPSCFKQFHGGGMDAMFQLCWRLRQLSNHDMDRQASEFCWVEMYFLELALLFW